MVKILILFWLKDIRNFNPIIYVVNCASALTSINWTIQLPVTGVLNGRRACQAERRESVINPKRAKVSTIFRLLVDKAWVMPVSIAEILSLTTVVVAISASSLRTGEALIVLMLLSLGLWGRIYFTG